VPHISVFKPIYTAEKILPILVDRIVASLAKITKYFEIIVVDNHFTQDDLEAI